MNRKGIMTVLLAGCMVVSAGCGKDAESKKSVSNDYVKVSQYKGIEIEKVEKEEVTDDFVMQYMESQLAGNMKEVTDRELREGDIAQFNYSGKLKSTGEVFDEGELTLGSGETYVPGFEEGIYGHKINETFDIELTFPEGYGGEANPQLSNAEVIFTITITSIKEKEFKEINDEFVKAVSEESETVEEYKKEVKEEIEESNYKNLLIGKVWEAFLENIEVTEYPDERLKETQETIQKQRLMVMEQYYGVTYEQYLEMSGTTEEEYQKELTSSAKQYLKSLLAAELIAEKEGIELSEEEYAEEMEVYAKENGYADVESLLAENDEKIIRETIFQNEVMEWLADNCKQTEGKEDTKE